MDDSLETSVGYIQGVRLWHVLFSIQMQELTVVLSVFI